MLVWVVRKKVMDRRVGPKPRVEGWCVKRNFFSFGGTTISIGWVVMGWVLGVEPTKSGQAPKRSGSGWDPDWGEWLVSGILSRSVQGSSVGWLELDNAGTYVGGKATRLARDRYSEVGADYANEQPRPRNLAITRLVRGATGLELATERTGDGRTEGFGAFITSPRE